MRIAIDGRVASRHFPGIGRYCQHLVAALLEAGSGHDLFVLYDPGQNPGLAALAAAERRRAGGPRARFVAAPVVVRSAAEQVVLPALVRRLRLDLFHAPYYAFPPLLPGRVAVTLYDVIPRLYPHYWPNPAVRRAIAAWEALALRRASAVLTLSAATRDDLYRLYGSVARDTPMTVTPCGADPRFLALAARRLAPGRHGGQAAGAPHARETGRDQGLGTSAEREPYFLYVGINKPHKNLPRLVEAYDRYRGNGGDGHLVMAGRWDARYPEAKEEVRKRGLEGRAIFRHNPSDEELAALYGGARAVVLASVYEGFGFPVLEAMAAAAPVLAARSSSLPEIGGEAVLYCDPTDAASIAAGMARLAGDPALRAHLARAGHERARAFTWRRTAEATLAAYEAACVH